MSLDATELRDLSAAISDRLFLQVAGWHLYLGDAGLAEPLAIECSARIDQGAAIAARQSPRSTSSAPRRWQHETAAGPPDPGCSTS